MGTIVYMTCTKRNAHFCLFFIEGSKAVQRLFKGWRFRHKSQRQRSKATRKKLHTCIKAASEAASK
jgi:hypothetical protein